MRDGFTWRHDHGIRKKGTFLVLCMVCVCSWELIITPPPPFSLACCLGTLVWRMIIPNSKLELQLHMFMCVGSGLMCIVEDFNPRYTPNIVIFFLIKDENYVSQSSTLQLYFSLGVSAYCFLWDSHRITAIPAFWKNTAIGLTLLINPVILNFDVFQYSTNLSQSKLLALTSYCIHGYFSLWFYFFQISLVSPHENIHFNIWLFIVMKTSPKLRN